MRQVLSYGSPRRSAELIDECHEGVVLAGLPGLVAGVCHERCAGSHLPEAQGDVCGDLGQLRAIVGASRAPI